MFSSCNIITSLLPLCVIPRVWYYRYIRQSVVFLLTSSPTFVLCSIFLTELNWNICEIWALPLLTSHPTQLRFATFPLLNNDLVNSTLVGTRIHSLKQLFKWGDIYLTEGATAKSKMNKDFTHSSSSSPFPSFHFTFFLPMHRFWFLWSLTSLLAEFMILFLFKQTSLCLQAFHTRTAPTNNIKLVGKEKLSLELLLHYFVWCKKLSQRGKGSQSQCLCFFEFLQSCGCDCAHIGLETAGI